MGSCGDVITGVPRLLQSLGFLRYGAAFRSHTETTFEKRQARGLGRPSRPRRRGRICAVDFPAGVFGRMAHNSFCPKRKLKGSDVCAWLPLVVPSKHLVHCGITERVISHNHVMNPVALRIPTQSCPCCLACFPQNSETTLTRVLFVTTGQLYRSCHDGLMVLAGQKLKGKSARGRIREMNVTSSSFWRGMASS